MVYREETLLNVIRSVTRNGRSIILTAVLALILVYIFSVVGYVFFKDDFLMDVDTDALRKGIDSSIFQKRAVQVGAMASNAAFSCKTFEFIFQAIFEVFYSKSVS